MMKDGLQAIRWMIWTPESVSTMSESSPTSSSNAASSNGFCIAPLVKNPKSPPRLAEEQSEYFSASSASVVSLFWILDRYSATSFRASSTDLLMVSSLHDDGRLLK